ncbi:MAG: hypothetical protein PHU21_11875 [Elusimicrobia bacterium]|nr:hypothetical protein [Elusimicrobiota bacterium]
MTLVTVALCVVGAAVAVGGRLLARKLEKKRAGVIDEGVGDSLSALGNLVAYALLAGGSALILVGLFLPKVLE